MTKPHLTARVICAESGEDLDAPPSYTLYQQATQDNVPMWARFYEGTWLHCRFADLEWHRRHGHKPRLVRVVSGS